MKKIILGLCVLAITALSANENLQLEINMKDGSPLIFGNEMIMVYVGDEFKEKQNKDGLSQILYRTVCSDKEVRKLIEGGMSIKYIYVHEKDITAIKVDTCVGVNIK